ncbi:MAG TPA: hypothetical protein VGF55_02105 [Gemmataceae bacterium]|jgi:hypothetical protein
MARHQRRWWGVLGALALACGAGCMSFPKPIDLPPECTAECADVPCACRGKVYVFLMSGLDPFDLDRVADFRAALIRAGFNRVYNGQAFHDSYFAREMHRLALEEPDARFVLVGFSLGADYAVSLAESVAHYNIPITLLASVDPYWWSAAPTERPTNVQQVMQIHGQPLLFANRASAGMDVEIPESFPTNITAHPLTVEHLARTLASIAGTLPRPELPPAAPVPDDSPTPRPITARRDEPRDAWDFLKPVASLRDLAPAEPAAPLPVTGERTTLRPAQPAVAE